MKRGEGVICLLRIIDRLNDNQTGGDMMFDSNFRGNIYIVKDNEVLYEKAAGFADLANEVP